MSVDPKALESKLREMYPDIDKYGFGLSLTFNEQKDAWIVKLTHEKHELTTHLEAERCGSLPRRGSMCLSGCSSRAICEEF